MIGAEVLTDTDGSLWLLWKDNPKHPWEFHTLKLTDEHGDMLEAQPHAHPPADWYS